MSAQVIVLLNLVSVILGTIGACWAWDNRNAPIMGLALLGIILNSISVLVRVAS